MIILLPPSESKALSAHFEVDLRPPGRTRRSCELAGGTWILSTGGSWGSAVDAHPARAQEPCGSPVAATRLPRHRRAEGGHDVGGLEPAVSSRALRDTPAGAPLLRRALR